MWIDKDLGLIEMSLSQFLIEFDRYFSQNNHLVFKNPTKFPGKSFKMIG